MAKGNNQQHDPRAGLRWSWGSFVLLPAAAIFFLSFTLPALHKERGIRANLTQLQNQRSALEKTCQDLQLELRSLYQDPQTQRRCLEKLRRELLPGSTR